MQANNLNSINIYLANPRSFCFGVVRAIDIVEETLKRFGAPIYVMHEIVHNKHVVNNFKQRGVVFIDDLFEINQKDKPVIISAHGASLDIYNKAKDFGIEVVDATCPLVKKIQDKVVELYKKNNEIIIIGKKDHQEIVGILGHIPNKNNVYVIKSLDEAKRLHIKNCKKLGLVCQTTLSVDETKEIYDYLLKTYPEIECQKTICMATTKRQQAVKEVCKKTDYFIVVGSKNSSNSKALQNIAMQNNVDKAVLVDDYKEINWQELLYKSSVGISAGASAPPHLVEEIIEQIKSRYEKINIFDVDIK